MKEIKFYNNYKVKTLFGRYITNKSIEKLLEEYDFNISGFSVNNLPIYSLSYGSGDVKILIWSQMHGNESTSTKALFDFLKTRACTSRSARDVVSFCSLPACVSACA